MVSRDRDDVSSRFTRSICKSDRLAESHGKAIVFGETMRRLTDRNLDLPILNPDLLIDMLERPTLVSDSCPRRQRHLDEVNRRREVRR